MAWAGAAVAELCQSHFGVTAASQCCVPRPSGDADYSSVCPDLVRDPMFPLELCCLGPDLLHGPVCGEHWLETMVVGSGAGAARLPNAGGLQARPLGLFAQFLSEVARFFLGEPLSARGRKAWRLLERSDAAVKVHCPGAYALTKLLRAELDTNHDDDRSALVAEALSTDVAGCSVSSALLLAGQRRVTYMSHSAHSVPRRDDVKTMAASQAADSSEIMELEGRWLERWTMRHGPNSLCWGGARHALGLTFEACCGDAPADNCWNAVYGRQECCDTSLKNKCGDLVLSAVVGESIEITSDDPLREFHDDVQQLVTSALSGHHADKRWGAQTTELWNQLLFAGTLIRDWPEKDLKERCPEAWLLSRIIEIAAPTLWPMKGQRIEQQELERWYELRKSQFTELPVLLISALAGMQATPEIMDSSRLQRGSQILSSGAQKLSESLNLSREVLACAAHVCDLNLVDEDATAAQACAGIGVRSEFGGAGRTTLYGRLLWCLAQRGTGPILDLYAGEGDSLVLLADALRRREEGRRLIISFEADVAKASRVAARLRKHGVLVHESHLVAGSGAKAIMNDIAEAGGAPRGSVGVLLFSGRTDTLVGSESETALSVVCKSVDSFWMVLLDPDVEMPPWAFAGDWRLLEPRVLEHLAIYNFNLPGGAGWVANRLRHLETYKELASGHNDGGAEEPDELLRMRAWILLRRDASQAHATTAHQHVEKLKMDGAEWSYSTMRAARGGAVLKVHESIGSGMIPVEMQRPTSELLTPPLPDTNPHACFMGDDLGASGSGGLRIPCFISCDGPEFDPAWSAFRRKLEANVQAGSPPDENLFVEASMLLKPVVNDDQLLVIGRSRFLARQRHEFTSDAHLEGFCLCGIASALLVRSRGFLEFLPPVFEQKGKQIKSWSVAHGDLELAFMLLSDSDSKSGIEFSFLENTPWPVRLEDILVNLELQRSSPGAAFQLLPARWSVARAIDPQVGRWIPPAVNLPVRVKLCGVGDHFSATFDAMLTVEQALASVVSTAGKHSTPLFERSLLGRFCPYHAGQRHQCRQRCQLMGQGCGSSAGGDQEDDADLVAQWLGGVIHPVSLEELPFDIAERRTLLSQIVVREPRLAEADLVACSHPSLLCILLAESMEKPVFAHASSTLLYGLPCDGCSGRNSTLRLYSGAVVESYLATARSLLLGTLGRLALLAEGSFLAKQIEHQIGVRVPWVPPLALYAEALRWQPGGTKGALVLRSRFFVTLMGELLRSLLREIASINGVSDEITLLGKDNQFDTQWLALEEFAQYKAAVLYPNDLHQRTFHELYRMGVPLLVPDAYGLYRAQRVANWGYASYGTGHSHGTSAAAPAAVFFGFAAGSGDCVPPWWDSFHAPPFPGAAPLVCQHAADWEELPHVQRFSSLPDLLLLLRSLPAAELSAKMREFHRTLAAASLEAVASAVLAIL